MFVRIYLLGGCIIHLLQDCAQLYAAGFCTCVQLCSYRGGKGEEQKERERERARERARSRGDGEGERETHRRFNDPRLLCSEVMVALSVCSTVSVAFHCHSQFQDPSSFLLLYILHSPKRLLFCNGRMGVIFCGRHGLAWSELRHVLAWHGTECYGRAR